LDKIDALLAEANSSKEQILAATVYLRDIKDFAAMNEIWDAWVPQGNTPARACVEARLAASDLLVEISIVAAIPS
jgi:enamine deaminase RidA (YjgF/YER057c/UK114 family)